MRQSERDRPHDRHQRGRGAAVARRDWDARGAAEATAAARMAALMASVLVGGGFGALTSMTGGAPVAAFLAFAATGTLTLALTAPARRRD